MTNLTALSGGEAIMEMGEEPRHRQAAANEETRQAVGATRVSLFAIVVAVLIGVALFGWLWRN